MGKELKPVCPGCGRPVNEEVTHRYIDERGAKWHKICYNLRDTTFKQLTAANEDDFTETDWYFAIFQYLFSRVRLPNPDWPKIANQIKRYRDSGMSYKGIYYALVYYFAIMKGDSTKAQGGIGIVAYIRDDAKKYWANYFADQQKAEKEVREAIEKLKKLENEIKTVPRVNKQPIKKDFSKMIAAAMEGLDE